MKKLFALILAAILVFSVVGCASTAPANPTDTTPATQPDPLATKPSAHEEAGKYPIVKEPITVKGLTVARDTSIRADGRLIWDEVSKITGINIEWEVIDQEALATYMAGNDWPDFIHYNLEPSLVNDYGVVGGRFVNYLDYLQYMPNLVEALEDYPVAKKAVIEANGEMYRLPALEKSATTAKARPYVRTDVLEAAGVKMPTTVEEFHDALVTLKEKNGVASFIPLLKDDEGMWSPMLFAAFGTGTYLNYQDDGTGKVIFNRTSEQMKHYLEWMHQLYAEGLIHQEFLTMDDTTRADFAKSGKVAFIGGGECHGLTAKDFPDGKFHLDCCAPLTSQYDKTQTLMAHPGYAPVGGFFMNKDCKYIPELCRMFDIMYATKEVVPGSGLFGQSFCYGIQGRDWDFDEKGSGTYSLTAPESYGGAFTTYQYGELIWYNAGRADALAGLITSTPGNGQARQKGFVKNVIPYQTDFFPTNFLKFDEDEQYVLDNHLADITSYCKEMEGKFITGVADIEKEWDTYCSTIDSMGIDEVLEVYQASYDRWNQ